MTRLSVNINKIATLRNARGGNNPDVLKVAQDCERYGAEGITVHPRPDERHIKYADVINLKEVVKTEFNIESLSKKLNPPKPRWFLIRPMCSLPTQVGMQSRIENFLKKLFIILKRMGRGFHSL